MGGQAPSNAEILKADRDRHGTPATVYGFSNLNSKPGRLGARGLALPVFRLAGWRARQVLPLLSAGPKLESLKYPSIGPRYLQGRHHEDFRLLDEGIRDSEAQDAALVKNSPESML